MSGISSGEPPRDEDNRGAEDWANPAEAAEHFRVHGSELGAKTLGEYVRKARAFFERAKRARLPTKIDPTDGRIRISERRTNTFGAYTPEGTPITFMKPKERVRYWNRQPGESRWGPL